MIHDTIEWSKETRFQLCVHHSLALTFVSRQFSDTLAQWTLGLTGGGGTRIVGYILKRQEYSRLK